MLFQILFPFRLLQNIENSFLCYAVGPCWFPILCTLVWICQSQIPNLSLPHFYFFFKAKITQALILPSLYELYFKVTKLFWRRLLRVPCTARSNQSILKEINPEYSLEGLMLKLKFQYFGRWFKQQTHWESLWCWERLNAGREEGIRGWDGWMASLMQWTWTWANFMRWWGTGRPDVLQCTGSQRGRYD